MIRRFLINNTQILKRDCNSFSKIKNFDPKNESTLNEQKDIIKKINLVGIQKEELQDKVVNLGYPKYLSDLIWTFMYNKGILDINSFERVSKDKRESLLSKYEINIGEVTNHQLSVDGTRKLLISFDGAEVESVFIPEGKRGTLCVSSQVGCTFACTFCHTGTQKFIRNLTASEIVSQVITAKKVLNDFADSSIKRTLTNIVFMGQGEPFYNYRNVLKAIKIITDPNGLAIGKGKITVSTSGVVPLIERLSNDFPGIGLAISLHSANDKTRSEIVPANKQWPISELVKACINFSKHCRERITIEYVMLQDVNDSAEDAHDLVKLSKSFPSLVNLIPFNPWPGSQYKCSTKERITEFSKFLEKNGIKVTIRQPRGRDILAACGQLNTESIKQINKPIQPLENLD
ncbi:hypothetical protein RB653_008432 [Dictyostelium firmibasis]|uniref:Radical SAM core domain-containing protein n=1 Tax=Dictyostelium firmibasis TaxID=79012 RepID=A0AAN7TSS3_9MYCE